MLCSRSHDANTVENSSLYSIVQIITIVLKILAFEKEKNRKGTKEEGAS